MKLAVLADIPENSKFTVHIPHVIAEGAGYEKGGCRLTLLPNQVYRVDQSLIGLVSAEGVCRVEQQSKSFGDVDKLMDVPFTIDPDLLVVAVE